MSALRPRAPDRRALPDPVRDVRGHGPGPPAHPRLQDARGPHHPRRGHGHHDRDRHERDRRRASTPRWRTQIESLGSSVIFVRPFAPRRERRRRGVAPAQGPHRRRGRGHRARCPAVQADRAHGVRRRADLIKYGNEKVAERAGLRRPPPAYETVHDIYVEQGPLPLRDRRRSRGAKVAVIGAGRRRHALPRTSIPLDKEISIDGRRFRVIGVMERKGKFLFFNRDNIILVPLGSVQKKDPRFNFLRRRRQAGRRPTQMDDGRRADPRDPAPRSASCKYLAEGQLRDLHPGHVHRPLQPAHRRHLPGDDRDLLDRPGGGRRRAS